MLPAVLWASATGSLERLPIDPNPFRGVDFVRSPKYTEGVQESVQLAGGIGSELGRLVARAARIPTAIWLDKVSELPRAEEALRLATEQQAQTGVPVLCVFVVYNLPGRDCSAKASNGEFDAAQGVSVYEERYLRPLEAIVRQFPDPRIVWLMEPDSLPNVVTNMHVPKCAAVAETYQYGIVKAAELLSPYGTVYLDAAWSGWIGTWSAPQMAKLLDDVLNRMDVAAASQVRGIVTDISNYGSLFQEQSYVRTMLSQLQQLGRTGLHAVIDTGRNAVSMGGQWCNANGAGAGEPPTGDTGQADIDAYFWVKPPGESDGISDPTSTRYDPECGKYGAMGNAPNAGEWFHAHFMMLMENAKPPLDSAPSYEPKVVEPEVVEPQPPPDEPAPSTPSALRPAANDGAAVWVSQEGEFGFSYEDSPSEDGHSTDKSMAENPRETWKD